MRIFAAQLYLHVSTEEGLTFVLQFTVTVVNEPVTIEREKNKKTIIRTRSTLLYKVCFLLD